MRRDIIKSLDTLKYSITKRFSTSHRISVPRDIWSLLGFKLFDQLECHEIKDGFLYTRKPETPDGNSLTITIDKKGRILIPSFMRKKLKYKDILIIYVVDSDRGPGILIKIKEREDENEI